MIGIVKWFDNEKGYGFVRYKDDNDVFIHYSSINIDGFKSLLEGQLVEFDLIETDKGYQGKNVKLLKESAFLK